MINNFNFNAKQVFLTYPQCALSKELALQALKQLSEVQDYIVASEEHKDGTPHLHAVIKFASRFHTKNPRAFDIHGYHPNIQGLKTVSDFKRTTDYCRKAGDFISNISEKKTANQLLAEQILAEGLTPELVRNNPQLIFKNFNQIRQWVGFCRPSFPRPISTHKKRHIWLYGPSNTGKTTWLRVLRSLYVCCEIPENNDFSFFTPTTEILYVDEYRGFLTVQQLNRIADGDTVLNTKGGSVKISSLLVIVVSNFSIADVYKNCTNQILDTLFNRFTQYDSSINLPPFPKYIIKN